MGSHVNSFDFPAEVVSWSCESSIGFGQVEHDTNFPLVASLLAQFAHRLPRKKEFEARYLIIFLHAAPLESILA